MTRWLLPTVVALLIVTAAHADTLTGRYVEARTCDVYTGPCFANGDMNLGGKNAVLGWKIDKGTFNDVALDGLSVAAVLSASDTLGLKQTGTAKAVIIVDRRASTEQRCALVRFAQDQLGGKAAVQVIKVEDAEVDVTILECKEGGCAVLKAGAARVKTRCIDHKADKSCGNEYAFYTPLVAGVKATPAVATEHAFTGKALNQTWNDGERRSAYVGSFAVTMNAD
jgi:hypothetical protein